MDLNKNIELLRGELAAPKLFEHNTGSVQYLDEQEAWPVWDLYRQILTNMRKSPPEELANTLTSGTFCFEYLRDHLENEGWESLLLDDRCFVGGWHRLWLSWRTGYWQQEDSEGYTDERRVCVGAAYRGKSREQSKDYLQRRGVAASKLFGVPFDAWHPKTGYRGHLG